ncbi:unnamed protein product [Musa acuminata subsp. malaccensis]|uniref:(wild Malaysian banana) hypothetical protein n=1 Tax=Musa acuminata subsp. malaccensis TaxID=214687 RepID=A0A8D6ZMQ2_MUSAM|nr:unnamed protein product [Musa acuminata subsp. malaccensis]
MYPSKPDAYYAPPTTGVLVTAPPGTFQVQSQAIGPWSTGLCDCCDDVGNCCITCFCPCITFGQISEIIDRGSTSCCASGALYALILCVTGCQCLYSCFYRSKLRGQYGLRAVPTASSTIASASCALSARCTESLSDAASI